MVLNYNSIRRRHHLTRSGIFFPSHSPWRNLYDSGDEESFLNLTDFSREAFEELQEYLINIGHQNHLGPCRPRLLNTLDELGTYCYILGQKCGYLNYV